MKPEFLLEITERVAESYLDPPGLYYRNSGTPSYRKLTIEEALGPPEIVTIEITIWLTTKCSQLTHHWTIDDQHKFNKRFDGIINMNHRLAVRKMYQGATDFQLNSEKNNFTISIFISISSTSLTLNFSHYSESYSQTMCPRGVCLELESSNREISWK